MGPLFSPPCSFPPFTASASILLNSFHFFFSVLFITEAGNVFFSPVFFSDPPCFPSRYPLLIFSASSFHKDPTSLCPPSRNLFPFSPLFQISTPADPAPPKLAVMEVVAFRPDRLYSSPPISSFSPLSLVEQQKYPVFQPPPNRRSPSLFPLLFCFLFARFISFSPFFFCPRVFFALTTSILSTCALWLPLSPVF